MELVVAVIAVALAVEKTAATLLALVNAIRAVGIQDKVTLGMILAALAMRAALNLMAVVTALAEGVRALEVNILVAVASEADANPL